MRRATAFAIAIPLGIPWAIPMAIAVLAVPVLTMLPQSAALADVFRSVDAQGHVQYTDTPTPGAELVRISGQRVSSVQQQAAPAPASGSSSGGSKPPSVSPDGDPIHQQLEREAAARAVQADVAQTHAAQCKKATDAYNASVEAHRIYRAGADGERVLLTDDEVDKERLANKLAMDTACGGQ
jgi:hypothetical protein